MKPSSEDGAAQAGGPWEECFEAAAQLALRAGQVSAAPGARQAHSDLGQSGRRALGGRRPRGPGRDLGARAAEELRAAYRTLCTCHACAGTGALDPAARRRGPGSGRRAAWRERAGQGARTASDLTQWAGHGAVAPG